MYQKPEMVDSGAAHHGLSSPRVRRPSSSSTHGDQPSSSPTLAHKGSVSSLTGVGSIASPRTNSMRRASGQFASSPAKMHDRSPTLVQPSAPPPPTPASVAKACFEKELALHAAASSSDLPSKTIVILQDDCYGHRFSRPRTTRASLSTIVERPERLNATIVGIAAAYVRLGGRHADGKYPPHPRLVARPPPDIPFRIRKSSRRVPLSSPMVTQVHGPRWMNELTAMCEAAEAKLALNGKELVRTESHAPPGEDHDRPRLHEGDLYLCRESLAALEGCLGAVCDGVDRIFGIGEPSRAFVSIRPPGHHCSAGYPSGFCWLNNVHVGIAHAAMRHGLTHAAIIDFDLHHGDGSQSIAWAHNAKVARLPKNAPNAKKTSLGYFSVHDINSYPCEMGDEEKVRNASLCVESAHGQTVWNVHLQPWKSEDEFWELYHTRYAVILDKARTFLRHHTQRLLAAPSYPAPKAAIFLSAGFDASEWEGAGMQRHKVNVPTDFYATLTRDVIRIADEEGLGVDGRILSVLEGGYSNRALTSGVWSHLCGLAGEDRQTRIVQEANGLGHEMGKRMGVAHGAADEDSLMATVPAFDHAWWSVQRLEQLDALVHPPPAPPPKKTRGTTPPTYSSPTQSFTAKINASPGLHRSVSGAGSRSSSLAPSRSVTPPPPDVEWHTSAHELSKLLIPADRSTTSCTPEELSADASRVKRERRSSPGLPTTNELVDGKRMTLRDRKARAPDHILEEEQPDPAVLSKADRRKTLAGPGIVADDAAGRVATNGEAFKQPTNQSRRRMSMASSVGSVDSELSRSSRAPSLPPNGMPLPSVARPTSQPRSRAPASGPTVAKKTRLPSHVRTEASKARTTKKPISISKEGLPTHTASQITRSGLDNATGGGQAGTKPPISTDPSKHRDIDALASSLTKIKLHVPPRAEHDAREKEKKKPVARPKKLGPVKPIAPKPTNPPTTMQHPPVMDDPFREGRVPPPPQKPTPSSSPALNGSNPSNDTTSSTTAPTSVSNTFIHYEVLPPSQAPDVRTGSLVWLPPNTSTPPAGARRGDLPTFTSNSPIPFAKAAYSTSTPAAVADSRIPRADPGWPLQQNLVGPEPANVVKPDPSKTEDMWAVPDTPPR